MKALIPTIAGILVLSACEKRGNTGSAQLPYSTLGTINGGGGIGIRCNGKLEMLDVFEARKSGLMIRHLPRSQSEAVQTVSNLLAEHFWNPDTEPASEVAKLIASKVVEPLFKGRPIFNAEENVFEQVEFVPTLPLSNDFGEVSVPVDCELAQVAYYSDQDRKLLISSTAWGELDWTSRAVLAAHEVVYLIYRRDGFGDLVGELFPETSTLSRKFIGKLFSGAVPQLRQGLPDATKLYICGNRNGGTDSTYLYAYSHPKTRNVVFVFNVLKGASSFYQTRAEVVGLRLEQVVNEESFPARAAPLEFLGDTDTRGLSITVNRTSTTNLFELGLRYSETTGSRQIGDLEDMNCVRF